MDDAELADGDAVRKYYDRDSVERAFKQMKGVLELRPVRVWLKSHIEGHIKVCYLAYALLAYLDYILRYMDISGSDALSILRTGYRVHLEDRKSGLKWETMVAETALQKKIMDVVIKNA